MSDEPWKKYQTQTPEESGPWAKYQAPEQQAPADTQQAMKQARNVGALQNLPVVGGIARNLPQKAQSHMASGMQGLTQGGTLGFSDEIIGGISSLLTDESYQDARDDARGQQNAARSEHPVTYLGGELAGGFATGGTGVARAGTSKVAGYGSTAAFGGAYGAGTAEGGLESRAKGAAIGSTLGIGAQFGLNRIGGAIAPFLKSKPKATGDVPSLEDLKGAKNALYQQADDLGAGYSPEQMQSLFQGIGDEIPTEGLGRITSRTHPTTVSMMRQMKGQGDKPATLTELDKLRQLAGSASVTNPADQRLAGIARQNIDEFTEAAIPVAGGDASKVLQQARKANQTFKKAEGLEEALEKARIQASSNRVPDELFSQRKAVANILKNPKTRRGLGDEEIAAMEKFVKGSTAEKVSRTIGKLGSGNVVGTSLGGGLGALMGGVPGAVGLPLAASVVRKAGERTTQKSLDDLVRLIRTGQSQAPVDTAASKVVQDKRLQEILARMGTVGAL